MDYDAIVKGRRRNWDPLKPEDEREKEKQERAAARKEKQGGKKSHELGREEYRTRLREQDAEAQQAKWERTKKQSIILAGGFILAMLLWGGITKTLEVIRHRSSNQALQQYQDDIVTGSAFVDMTTPVLAFATWRSVWLNGDMKAALDLFSPQMRRVVYGNRAPHIVLGEWDRMYKSGAFVSRVELAKGFKDAEILHLPGKPWSNGDLATFRSRPFLREGEPGEPNRYVVSFSYDSGTSKWRFADVRDAINFSVRWRSESQILALKGGINAPRYDENGNMITN